MRVVKSLLSLSVLLFGATLTVGVLVGATGQANADEIFTTLDVPGATNTPVNGINNVGQVYTDVNRILHRSGSYTTLESPGATNTEAHGINATGQIVGFTDSGLSEHSFLLNGDTHSTLDAPGPTQTFAVGINDAGEIVGYWTPGGGPPLGFRAAPIPEPSTLLLFTIGTLGLMGWTWRRHLRTA